MEYRDNPETYRYVAIDDDRTAGFMQYLKRAGRYLVFHTEVDEEYAGQGVAKALVTTALDDMAAKDAPIVPLCPYVAKFIERNDQYAHLVDEQLMEQIHTPQGG